MKRADAILTADWHLRDDVPICRTDCYWETQERKVDFLIDLQNAHECPVLIAGDLFEKAKSSPYLEAWAIKKFDKFSVNSIGVPGQHDLPNHNINLYWTSSLAVLDSAGSLVVLRRGEWLWGSLVMYGFPYGKKIKPYLQGGTRTICLAHYLVRKGKPLWPGMEVAERGRALLDRLNYDLIVTGDNHQPFVVEREGKLLVNPGSLKRDEADQIDHKPRVYLWYAEENEVEPVYIPIEEGVVSREHLEREENREERVSAFVRRLEDDYEVALSYKKNLKAHMLANETRESVQDLVWRFVEDE